MKRLFAVLVSLALAISMMPLAVFADEDIEKKYGPNDPYIDGIEEWVTDESGFVSALFRDDPVLTNHEALGREAEDYGFTPYFATSFRLKMDANLHVKVESEYSGNLYVGIWKSVKNEDGIPQAVEVKKSIGKTNPQRQFDLEGLKNNEVYLVAVALCGDINQDDIQMVNTYLEIVADPQGEDEGCVHVPWKIERCDAECGWDGYKTHWECQDCGVWMIKDKESGEYRPMKKAEKKNYTLKMPAKKHSFTKKVRNTNTRKHKASCTRAAEYYYSCKNCGACGSKTFKYGKKLGHKYKKNYTIPATYDKAGKTGTICTRCKKTKKGTKVTTIPKIKEALLLAEPWYVGPQDKPKFTVTVNGKKINTKYYTVTQNYGEYGEDGVRLVVATAKLKGKYNASAFCIYFEFNHEPTAEEKAQWDELFKQIEE